MPNPFERVTAISVPLSQRVVHIYDAAGRRVRTLAAENGQAFWDGMNDEQRKVSQGIYFGIAGEEMVKLILLK
jgi:flagellar hook assembly protein FlgD